VKRVLERGQDVHFAHPGNPALTLCGRCLGPVDLLGNPLADLQMQETAERVNCVECARTVCAIRNEPYNTLKDETDERTAMQGIYAAIQPPEVPGASVPFA